MPLKTKATLSTSGRFLITGGRRLGRPGEARKDVPLSGKQPCKYNSHFMARADDTLMQTEHSWLCTTEGGNATSLDTHVIYLQWMGWEELPCPLL